MLSKNKLIFYSLLLLMPTFAIADLSYANKIQVMKGAIDHSPLNLEEKIEHMGNRLGYGTSPLPFNTEVSAKKDAQYADLVSKKFATVITEQLTYPSELGYSEEVKSLATGLVVDDSGISHFDSSYDQITNYMNQDDKFDGISSIIRDQVVKLKVLKALFGSQHIKSNVLDPNIGPQVIDDQINLRAVLDEFWFNHFNIDLMKAGHLAAGKDGYDYMIHQKMYTTFYDLLKSVTTHPAMLMYLDNARNRIVVNTYYSNENPKAREVHSVHILYTLYRRHSLHF